ncbi:sigma-54-dependent Fis family transcriptional regulator [Bacillus sp. T3]|uniref:sigma-54-dependent Fis family transcriptional regulator n=1 Tax=Bacillus sp. T3 TaxID=467262 RepID=UPI002980CD57|nr:sigma-54-dependent Fis family transcriptional regulator [Bacillus sp. T3]
MISIFSTQDIPNKTKELTALWERYVTKSWETGEEINQLRKNVLDSWRRCQTTGVNPQQMLAKPILSEYDLKLLWTESELFKNAKPIIDDFFYKMKGTGYLITLANHEGCIIYLKGEPDVMREAERMNFSLGMDWSEASAGTNAIGTSIVTKKPIQIFSAEHFCQGCHPWTCSSAPITHPFTKEIIGAIDLTGFWGNAQPHTLGLAVSLSQLIQHELAKNYLQPNYSLIGKGQHQVSKTFYRNKLNEEPWQEVIGTSEILVNSLSKCNKAAPSNVPVLLLGESGTGKEKIAQAIHKSSLRSTQPFLAINCGAIQKELIGSELFGYEKGAFTGASNTWKKGKFEEANGGTLFLDEIGEMPLDLQVHLLRVLQEKEVTRLGSSHPISVNVRIIAATNKNLFDLCKQGQFREDLLFRLNVVTVNIPPLRERLDDLQQLSDHFLDLFSQKYLKEKLSISEEISKFFYEYHWPGNIRELQNVLEHAVLFCEEDEIRLADLPHYILEQEMNSLAASSKEILTPIDSEERKLLIRLLDETGWNLSAVAKKMNIARSTLYRKLKKYQLNQQKQTLCMP